MDDHTCNAWCAPPTHCHLVLISPHMASRDAILTFLAPAYYTLHKRVILDARPAYEAEKARVVEAKVGSLGISTRNRIAVFSRTELEALDCWLITYLQEDDDSCTPASSN